MTGDKKKTQCPITYEFTGEITDDPKGVAKPLDGLNVHKAPGPDGLNVRVLKECISHILALIYNDFLPQGKRDDGFAFFVFMVSRDCSVALPRGATALSAVCDCGIS